MGQKVNPTGARLGLNKNWSAHWFSDSNYAQFLSEDRAIRGVVAKRYPRSGIDSVEIFRNRGDINVTIHTSKLGVIIRRSGIGIQELKADLEHALFAKVQGKQHPAIRITILEVKNPELSARIVAENVAGMIERRISPKRAIRQTIERTMEKRAKGIKVRISGRLNGAEIARSESSASGSIPLQTLRSNIMYAQAQAKTTYGIIGVKVWIYLGELDRVPEESHEQASRNAKGR